MTVVRVVAMGLLFAGVAVSSALAAPQLEEKTTLPDGRSFSVWLGGSLLSAPVANGLGSVGDAGSFLFFQQTDNAASLPMLGVNGGVAGWLPTEKFLMFGELDTDLAHGTTSYQTTIGQNSTFVDILPLNGQVSPGAILNSQPAGTLINDSTIVDYGRVTAAIGLGKPDQGAAKVGAGVLVSLAGTHLQSTVSDVGGTNFVKLDETVSMQSFGPMLAGQWDTAIGEKASVTLGGRLGILFARGDLSATETSTRTTGLNINSSATAAANALAGLVEVNGTLAYAVTDALSLSLTGGVGARNDYFSIVNPRSGSGIDANDPASYHPGAASLQQNAVLSAKVSVGLHGSF
jgi:hypothetical protein